MRYNLRIDPRNKRLSAPHSQAVLKSLKAVRTSLLFHQCQKALNDISIRHVVGLFWVPGHA